MERTGWLGQVFYNLSNFSLWRRENECPPESPAVEKISEASKKVFAEASMLEQIKQKSNLTASFEYFEHSIKSWQKVLIDREQKIEKMLQMLGANEVTTDLLKWFFAELPKGGDLHMHMEGSFPPKTLRHLAIKYDLYYDRSEKMFFPGGTKKSNCVYAKDMPSEEWEEIFNLMSIRDISKGSKQANKKFFAAFRLIGSILDNVPIPEQVRIMKKNAQRQNIGYNEIMGELAKTPKPVGFEDIFPKEINDENLEKAFNHLKQSGYIDQYIEESTALLNACDQDVFEMEFDFEKLLSDLEKLFLCLEEGSESNLESNIDFPVQIGYNLEVMRNRSNGDFFASAAAAMALAQKDPRVFGFTVDGPQHEVIACDNFLAQMKIIEWLKKKFPDVPLTIHACEVNPELSTMEEMQEELWNIFKYVDPKRVGHVTALSESRDPPGLLKHMKANHIGVEVCISSVKVTTGKTARKNPIFLILQSEIPVTLNSDDEGLTFSNLSREFLKAYKCGISYKDITIMIRSSLHYSFLPGESILKRDWLEGAHKFGVRRGNIFNDLFQEMHNPKWRPSREAVEFLKSSRKAQVQFIHEKQLVKFEEWAVERFKKSLIECKHLPFEF